MVRKGDLKLIQELNRFIILDTIRQHGPISRSEVAKRHRISPTTVTSCVNELMREGFVYEYRLGESSGGRKPILVRFAPDGHILLGVSLTNSTVSIAEMNLEAKIRKKKMYSLSSKTGESVTTYVLDLIQQFIEGFSSKEKCIGISIIAPGIVDATQGIIRYNAKLNLKDIALKEMVEDRFGMTTWLDNDINAMTLAENSFGKFKDCNELLHVSIGDGVGAGIIVNGNIFRGFNGGAGEFGHTSVDRAGIRCDCGNIGCIENYISWPSIYSRIVATIKEGKKTRMLDLAEGEVNKINVSLFHEAVYQGDKLANEILREISSVLSVGLVNLVNLFNPEVIILSGEMVLGNTTLISQIKHTVSQNALDFLKEDLQINFTSFGDDNGLIGAAAILLQDVFQFSLGSN
jgi:N-acetylglucosamine repressor